MNMNVSVLPSLQQDFVKASQSRDVHDVARYLFLEKTELCAADLILAFGNLHILQQTAAQAARLYHDGYAPLIIASGGIETADGRTEAVVMHEHMRALGVPDHAILMEPQSRHTQENVLYSRALFSETCPAVKADSLIGVGHVVAGRRFLMTIAKNWPEISLPMASNVWRTAEQSVKWKHDARLQGIIMDQFDRIAPYLEKGFIAEVDIPRINAAVLNRHMDLAV